MMRGTNAGPFAGSPPTGRTVALPGADFITVEGDKIRSVQGYFDQKTFLEQLGLQVIAQPYTMGPISFGTGVTMQVGKHTKPGAFSLTSIRIRADEMQQLQEYSIPILAELAQMPGFISFTSLAANNCGYTITAWEDAESASQMLRAGAHRQAMQAFLGPGFAEGGMTSVWIPHHINALWVRCPACGRMSDYAQDDGKCQCGQSLPPLPYW
jgi:heme-degrading monooxygenase HmoA